MESSGGLRAEMCVIYGECNQWLFYEAKMHRASANFL